MGIRIRFCRVTVKELTAAWQRALRRGERRVPQRVTALLRLADQHTVATMVERDHLARADPARHPELFRLGRTLAELDELAWVERHWIRSTPEEVARWTIACWTERCELVVEDLLAIPGDAPIVAEGAAFFRPVVAPLLVRRE